MQERVIENLDGREGGENRVVLRLISTKFIPLKGEDRQKQTKMMPIDDNMCFFLFLPLSPYLPSVLRFETSLIRPQNYKTFGRLFGRLIPIT